MEVAFASEDLDRLETDPQFTLGLPAPVVSKYRQRMQTIRAASDTRDLRKIKSLHFEKLKGNRSHQHSIRLNRQYRLVMQVEADDGAQRVVLLSVEDYH